jgi:Ca2+-binding RTX toxin-like protein
MSGRGVNDFLKSGVGDDKLSGGAGNDHLDGDFGPDSYKCGPGTDNIILFEPDAGDTKSGDCENIG